MRVISLGSGSSGNALLIEAGPQGRTRLLVDAGLSVRLLTQRLRAVGVHPAQLRGVLVTHEHSDHVVGLPVLMKRYAIPVITDSRTYAAIEDGMRSGVWRSDSGKLVQGKNESVQDAMAEEVVTIGQRITRSIASDVGQLEISETMSKVEAGCIYQEENMLSNQTVSFAAAPLLHALPAGSQCIIGDIEITSFPISHDAVAPCGYLLHAGGCRVCVVTDSGEVTPAMLAQMRQADLLVLESNHDRERLVRGPYPWSLKNRILSTRGHLSNDQAAEAVLRTWPADGVRWLWLAHLSRTNNTPGLALESMRLSLLAANANLAHIHISTLPPGSGHIWDSTQLWHTPSLWQMEH